MDAFHVVIDTSALRQAHFRHPDFQRLLRQSKKGSLHIYIPHIVLEEQRTHLLADLYAAMDKLESALSKLRSTGAFTIFTEGLPEPRAIIWTKAELAQHSRQVFDKFLTENKIEKLEITEGHALRAWTRYFEIEPPFRLEQSREDRRKDIPDSWILEAARDLLDRRGRHCALVGDGRLKKALEMEGFEVFESIDSLENEIERCTAVVSSDSSVQAASQTSLDDLRGSRFKGVDLAIIGFNEALRSPSKEALFEQLERAGISREVSEHEAKTLVLAGQLKDTGNHYLPVDRQLANDAATSEFVTALLLKLL